MSTATKRAVADQQLGRQDVAELLGILPTSIGTYMRRGRMPQPDGRIGRSPWWWRSTIDKWTSQRPRSGYNPQTHANAPAKAAQRRTEQQRAAMRAAKR